MIDTIELYPYVVREHDVTLSHHKTASSAIDAAIDYASRIDSDLLHIQNLRADQAYPYSRMTRESIGWRLSVLTAEEFKRSTK